VKLSGDGGWLELEKSDLGPPGTPGDGDILLNVTAEVSGFSAADQSWVTGPAWAGFLTDLARLETNRKGRATLLAASPEDLQLAFFSTDRAGHMALRGQIRRMTPDRFDLRLGFGFAFAPDELPRILSELRRLGAH
jgi:hypothetical protein